MKHLCGILVIVLLFPILLFGCQRTQELSLETTSPPSPTPVTSDASPTAVVEQAIVQIPLDGPLQQSRAEVSGMDWYGDMLVLMPQYPQRFKNEVSPASLFTLSKQEILDFVEGRTEGPLKPREVPLWDKDVEKAIDGFEGYEAIVFVGDKVFLAVEASPRGGMKGYLVGGAVAEGLAEIRLDSQQITEIELQGTISNFSNETLFAADDKLLSLYEANGANVNPQPQTQRFTFELAAAPPIPFPTIEYRVTDASEVDPEGYFWVINYFWSGDARKLDPATDQLAVQFGLGPTHARLETVERLIELHYSTSEITLAQTAPVQLELLDSDARNWEGLVRLDEQGFLLVTDSHPETMLAFVPVP